MEKIYNAKKLHDTEKRQKKTGIKRLHPENA